MKKMSDFRSFMFSLVVLVSLILVAGSAYATNGYFSSGYSIKNKALAGAGTALALDTMSASTNPAAMAFVGDRVDVGLSFFNPNRGYTVRGDATSGFTPGVDCNYPGAPLNLGPPCPFGLATGTVESGKEWFVIPGLGYNKMMNKDYSLGISVFGNGGMNTDYGTNTYLGSDPTGIDLMQLFIVPTYARKINKDHAFGLSPVIAYQRLEAKGLEQFGTFSSEPTKLTNKGYDSAYGIGARVGYLGEVLPGLHVGASYQTKIMMNEFDKYAGLFAEQGDFDIPSTWNIGLAYDVTPALTVVFDVQEIYYSDVDSVGNTFNPQMNTCFGNQLGGSSTSEIPECLGNDQGAGFGWEDMTVLKAGVQWVSNQEWTWRAGYSYAEQPIGPTEVMFNMIAPGVIEQHVTAGVTKKLGGNQEVDLSVMRGLSNSITGPNPMDPPDGYYPGSGQTIELEMDQWEFSVGYSKSF
ncbi:MAG: outer membrane protein transport protein [Thermodesulfovibrionia bacterium]|nr:outer membrane protein transport protein [Thermodesulfovibrionia bacterium]